VRLLGCVRRFDAPSAGIVAPGTIAVVDSDVILEYRRQLERLAQRLCGDPHDAEDVAQSALMKAVQGRGDFRGEATVMTWLHRIASNECLMLRRRKRPGSLDALMETGGYEEGASGATPEELAMVSETQAEVLSALQALPEHHRNVVMLVDGCGMSYAEVAQLLGTTTAAVRSTLFRARKTLRAHLTA
jgi:RNA polymerase sigma-70 factor (ECF subfamily)